MMVRRLLPGCAMRRADAADALAVAICHAHHAGRRRERWSDAPAIGSRDDREAHAASSIPDRAGRGGASMSAASAISSSARRARWPGCRRPAARRPALIETHVREDHIHLYGFVDAAERDWFRLLTTVQGVGARLALAVLACCGPDELALAIAAQDKASLARADGVGPKLPARIVNELQGQGRRHRASAPALAALPRATERRRDGRCGLGAGQSRLSPGRGLSGGRRGGAAARRRRRGRRADPRRACRSLSQR